MMTNNDDGGIFYEHCWRYQELVF